MNVLDLYREDATADPLQVSGGREYRGPCPGCGGEDRFGVFPQQNDGEGSFFCGRMKGGGKGCGTGGDGIAYLRAFRNMDYAQACRYLGKEPKGGGGKQYLYATPKTPRKSSVTRFVPEDRDYPSDVVDPALWRQKGMEFVDKCHQALLQRKMSITYLLGRGISMRAILKHKLGFHEGEERNGRPYQMTFRPWPSWGLRDEKKESGQYRCIKLPAGLVIPYIVDDHLRSITIRLVKPSRTEPKYDCIKGSIKEHFLINPEARAFVVSEAQFDAIAVDDAAGDLVGAIGIGSTGVRPDMRSAAALDQSLCILGAQDNDPPRLNPKTGRMESPGADACRFWFENYPKKFKRWPVPEGKDPGEAVGKGVDLRLWIMAGLPPALLPEQIIEQPAVPPSAEEIEGREHLAELRDILRDANGYVRIYDDGYALGPDVPRTWAEQNPRQRSRLTWLLTQSEAVARWIEELGDGLYGADRIPG